MTRQRESTILIVDDDPGVRESLGLVLEAEGYSTDGASNGKAALDYLQQSQLPCLILLDLVMPLMNGWKFREAQLLDPFLEFIPLVLLSADANVKEHAETMRVAGFLTKPIDVQGLFEMVRSH